MSHMTLGSKFEVSDEGEVQAFLSSSDVYLHMRYRITFAWAYTHSTMISINRLQKYSMATIVAQASSERVSGTI